MSTIHRPLTLIGSRRMVSHLSRVQDRTGGCAIRIGMINFRIMVGEAGIEPTTPGLEGANCHLSPTYSHLVSSYLGHCL